MTRQTALLSVVFSTLQQLFMNSVKSFLSITTNFVKMDNISTVKQRHPLIAQNNGANGESPSAKMTLSIPAKGGEAKEIESMDDIKLTNAIPDKTGNSSHFGFHVSYSKFPNLSRLCSYGFVRKVIITSDDLSGCPLQTPTSKRSPPKIEHSREKLSASAKSPWSAPRCCTLLP